MRDEKDTQDDEPFIRGEKLRLLHGAVSMADRKGRLGQYYTVLWADKDGVGSGPVEVTFEFQQGKTASRIQKRTAKFAANDGTGKTEFSVIGDDYFKNGRVLAWKTTLLRGGRVLDSKQSYLWR